MIRCLYCGREFNEPIQKRVSFQAEYGDVDSPYAHGTSIKEVCPFCYSDEIEEAEEETEEDEDEGECD